MVPKPKLEVVLVEDDADLADVTQMALEQEGLSVAVAHDGNEGLALIDSLRPHVVVTDLVMPVLDGLAMIKEHTSRKGARAPVIAVSAIGSRLHRARELGAVEALLKPVHPVELAACIRKAARGESGAALHP